jgi:DNA end-binding protein Ku
LSPGTKGSSAPRCAIPTRFGMRTITSTTSRKWCSSLRCSSWPNTILKTKATDFDPLQFVDHYEEAVVELLKKKQAGLPVARERVTPRPQNAVNLMEALRLSIAQESKAISAPSKMARKQTGGQGEMLLPILGTKGKHAMAKPAGRATARQQSAG